MLDNKSLCVIRELCAAGYEAYIVGGYVRDLFDNAPSHDVDIATNASSEELVALFGSRAVAGCGTRFLVTIVDGIEVATYREDYYDKKECSVTKATSIEDDLSRRDFTINAMAMCPFTGDLIDKHGGQNDMSKKVIRFVGDAHVRINEHPVRILRACRFLAKIEGEFSTSTLRALQINSHLLREVPMEAIRSEILKAMKYQNASLFFQRYTS